MLIEHGALVNKCNADGQTALILAALGGHKELVRVLLGAGADPTVANPHGQTALDIATAMEKKARIPNPLSLHILFYLHLYWCTIHQLSFSLSLSLPPSLCHRMWWRC